MSASRRYPQERIPNPWERHSAFLDAERDAGQGRLCWRAADAPTVAHLPMLSLLLLDGPLTVSQLAGMLGVAPTTVSLIVGDLCRKGILVRREDDADRRRIIDISPDCRPAIAQWLSPGAHAWRRALAPPNPAEQRTFVDTLLRYEAAVSTPTQTAPGGG
ncbi:helix-turn-helix domain-containing protein [Micromonosporaceae bacterium B7E4]